MISTNGIGWSVSLDQKYISVFGLSIIQALLIILLIVFCAGAEQADDPEETPELGLPAHHLPPRQAPHQAPVDHLTPVTLVVVSSPLSHITWLQMLLQVVPLRNASKTVTQPSGLGNYVCPTHTYIQHLAYKL